MPKTPKLRPLRYGRVLCELCGAEIKAGHRVAFWRIRKGHRTLDTAYCPDCHHANVQHGYPLRGSRRRTR